MSFKDKILKTLEQERKKARQAYFDTLDDTCEEEKKANGYRKGLSAALGIVKGIEE